MRVLDLRFSATIIVLALLLVNTASLRVLTRQSHRALPQPPISLACTEVDDLVVDGNQITMTGTFTFDRVCLQNRATLRLRGTLRAGSLLVDASSHLSADGQTDEAQYPFPCHDGQAGGRLTIVTREAVILGYISANGETGYDGFAGCGYDGANGGNGGQLTVEAARLTLQGDISATGGSGGAGATDDPTIGSHGGNGASGGSITLITGQPLAAATKAYLRVAGGRGGRPGTDGARTRSGGSGQVILARLSPAQWAHLPPPPAADITVLTPPPRRETILSPNIFAPSIACGRRDLRLAPNGGMILGGSHTYGHICLARGAALTASGPLFLHAQTILLDSGATLFSATSLTVHAQTIVLRAGATIQADAVIGTRRHGPATGRYQDAGTCQPNLTAIHQGIPGAPGETGQAPGSTSVENEQSYTPRAGAGGGALTLIARRVLLAGTLSAVGGDGEPGADGFAQVSYVAPPTRGAGGGSGGGIMVMADELQLSGRISVVGGLGGAGGRWNSTEQADGGMHGGPGCVKLFVNILRTPRRPLPVVGPLILGRR